jgi:hypothetical protein
MFGRRALPVGSILIVLAILLATVGVGYGLWSEKLVIGGTVRTGEVDVGFSGPIVYEYVLVNGQWGEEPAAKDPFTGCAAAFYDYDPGSDGMEGLAITVEGAYPGYLCDVVFDVSNIGSVPVKITQPIADEDNPALVFVDGCYSNWTQLEPGESVYCAIWTLFDNEDGIAENATFNFHFDIEARQWNEAP